MLLLLFVVVGGGRGGEKKSCEISIDEQIAKRNTYEMMINQN
jgi:hypothetical protein